MAEMERNIKNIFPGSFVSDELCVVNLGYEQCLSGHTYGPHTRDQWLFHFVVSGKGYFKRGGKQYSISKNHAFLIRPDEITTYSASSSDPWYYVWLGFKGSGAEKMISMLSIDECVFEVDPDFIYELESLYRTVEDSDELSYKATGMAYKLFGILYASRHREKRRSHDSVLGAISFIENNYFRQFDMAWLASELGMSRGHFSALFSSVMGCSPYNYLTKYRIAKAQTLLLSGNLTVSEIATAVGFSALNRFDLMFIKYVGVSPSQYRKQKLSQSLPTLNN